jgi:hypothetical protein
MLNQFIFSTSYCILGGRKTIYIHTEERGKGQKMRGKTRESGILRNGTVIRSSNVGYKFTKRM